MDLWLEKIELHDSLHGCLAGRGTGMGIIEVKLAQQLAHLEQAPFFGVFIDLKKHSTPWTKADASPSWHFTGWARRCSD
jgi:hypothetical protein